MMKTDIQIAQEAELMHIKDVAASIGISEEELEFYGKYKAKLSDELWENVKDRKDGKLVLVTAINPTPAGEGKTTITVGLGEAFAKINKKGRCRKYYYKKIFETWQNARIYQQDLFNKGVNAEMWEDRDDSQT